MPKTRQHSGEEGGTREGLSLEGGGGRASRAACALANGWWAPPLGGGPWGRGDVARVSASRPPRLRALRTRRRPARLRGRFAARGRGGCGAGSVRGWRIGGPLGDLAGGTFGDPRDDWAGEEAGPGPVRDVAVSGTLEQGRQGLGRPWRRL